MEYNECKVYSKISKSETPIISNVPCDEFTNSIQNNFDYDFNGITKFYPYEFPKGLLNENFRIIVICGASGSGKSTLLKQINFNIDYKKYDNKKAIISNFETPLIAQKKLSAVGLNSIPTWCKPRNVLSIGEGFRADIALNLKSNMIFDEFTSTIDRNVAKSTCNGIHKYIEENDLKNIIFCSCHKDYISYLQPDFVIDLDDENVYDCRGVDLKKASTSKFTNQMTNQFGGYLGNIII